MKKFDELISRYNDLVKENRSYHRKEKMYASVCYSKYSTPLGGKFKELFEDLNSEIDLLRITTKDKQGCFEHVPVGTVEQREIVIELIQMFLGKNYKKDIELFDSESDTPPKKYKVDDIFLDSIDYINPISDYMCGYIFSLRGRKYNVDGKIGRVKSVARMKVERCPETSELNVSSIYIAGRIS
jgi:hypothetical protein